MPAVERPVALVVEASFDSERFTIDTTTIDGQRVVVMQQRDGVRYLTAAETLALSRALLSRLAYVGFPDGSIMGRPAPMCGDHPAGSIGLCSGCQRARAEYAKHTAGVTE